MSGPKEQVYDERINPLMAQIIAICKETGLQMFATFELDVQDGDEPTDPLLCTTLMEFTRFACPKVARAAALIVPEPAYSLAEIIETMPDGTKRITIQRIA